MPEKVRISRHGGVGVLTLDDPATRNAAGRALIGELDAALSAFAEPGSGVRSVVITGEGRTFCAGGDRSADGPPSPEEEADPGGLGRVYNPFLTRMRDCPLPIVAAVNGPAVGFGASLAIMADLVLVAESAFFQFPFRHVGAAAGGAPTYLLARLVGKARAMELVLMGERLGAAQAQAWGLACRSLGADALMPEALRIATALAEGPRSLGDTRRLLWRGLDAAWREQLAAEAAGQREAAHSADFREGVAAFLEKRPARFEGR